MRDLAGVVWREQNKAYAENLNLQEETITECLLLQMARDLPKSGFRVKLYTRARENQIGADWIWFFRQGACRIGFRVQAKKLYRRYGKNNTLLAGRYDAHSISKGQTQTLIGQAGRYNPIYVFYNHEFIKDRRHFRRPSTGFKPPSFWGCSVASANFVDSNRNNSLKRLASGMRPWHELFQPGIGCGLANGLRLLPDQKEIMFHDQDPEWLGFAEDPLQLQSYLKTEKLNGIAYFDATDVREDYFVPR